MAFPSREMRKLAWALFAAGPLWLGPSTACFAQSSNGESRSDRGDSSRDSDERRESWRSRFSDRGSYRGRDSRSSRDEPSGDGANSASSSSRSSSSRSSSSPGSEGTSMGMTDYARSLVKQHDQNGNMMLEGDERRNLRGRAAEADLNKDGVITIDELVAHLSSGTSGSTSSSGSTSTSSSRSSGSDSSERRESDGDRDRDRFFSYRRGDRDRDSDERRRGDSSVEAAKRVYVGSAGGAPTGEADKDKRARRTWRFTPPAERLPTGLPSWFKSRDANGDGQVSMSEYSRTWSKRTVEEFRALDLNNDGVITPHEAAAKK